MESVPSIAKPGAGATRGCGSAPPDLRTGAPSGLYQLNCTHTTALRGFRLGARRAVVCVRHKRRATTPGAAGASPAYRSRGDTPPCPPGSLATPPFGALFPLPRGSRGAPRIRCRGDTPRWPPGVSGRLSDGPPSPAPPLLPGKREKRSYGCTLADAGPWCRGWRCGGQGFLPLSAQRKRYYSWVKNGYGYV